MMKKFELFAGCLGNGITFSNKAVMEHGDYKKIAHVSDSGKITWYVKPANIPADARQRIEQEADRKRTGTCDNVIQNAVVTQNWMSMVGFMGKRDKGFRTAGSDTVATDYVELKIEPNKESPLYFCITYTKEDWMKEHPEAVPFIEADEEHHGDYLAKPDCLTMKESIDRIIAYVHFNHSDHEYNCMFFEVGNVETREPVELVHILSDEEKSKLINYAKDCLRTDLLKNSEYAQWAYSEYAAEQGVVDVEENTGREW